MDIETNASVHIHSREDFIHALLSIGLLSLDSLTGQIKNAVPVLLNGIFIGYLSRDIASDFVDNLRKFKIKSKHKIQQRILLLGSSGAQK